MIFVRPSMAQVLSPEKVAQELQNLNSNPPSTLVHQYKLTQDLSGVECGAFSETAVKTLWSQGTEQIVAIETNSATCVRKFLIIFDGDENHWKYSGTIALEERDTEPTYKTMTFFTDQAPQIAVSNNVVDSGTGIFQANMQIFAFVDGSLRVVFNEPETVRLALPFKKQCCPVQYEDIQTSKFEILPSKEHQPAQIEETRHVSVNGRSLTQYRRYVWNARWNSFYAVAFAPTP